MVSEICLRIALPYIERVRERERECVCYECVQCCGVYGIPVMSKDDWALC